MRHALAAALTGALLALDARAQVTLSVATDARARPGGTVIATLMPGARVAVGAESGSESQVTLEGWVDASRLGPRRDSFPASVSGRLTLRVRAQASPRGAIVAVLQPGAGLHTLARQGTWTRVRRTLWASTAAVRRPAAVTTAPATAAQARAEPRPRTAPETPAPEARRGATTAAPTASPAQGNAARESPLHPTAAVVASAGAAVRDLPVGRVVGELAGGSAVEIVGRQSGWVRIRLDGWVPERDLVGGDSLARPAVRAADLRADPNGMKGRVVQWDVEVMSLQLADPLRVELARDEPYLLARGPGSENAILYLAVPPSLLAEARALPPLARVHITARVRSGRSEPAGTPILELLSIARR